MLLPCSIITAFVLLFGQAQICQGVLAYIGPSTGITLLAALLTVLLAVVFAVGGLVIWPFRALMSRLRKKTKNTISSNEA